MSNAAIIDTREVLELRASRMPIAFACPASIRMPSLRIRETNDAADMGTAAHVGLRPVAAGIGVQWDDLPGIADRYACDPEELRMLVAMGAKLWKGIGDSFPAAQTEVPMSLTLPSGYTITGSADIVSRTPKALRLADWKTGRKDSDYRHQMRAYASMALLDSDLDEATATILWVRDQEIENLTMTRGDAEQWVRSVDKHVVNWDGVYHAGPQCTYCPRAHECEARSALVRRSIADVLGTQSDSEALASLPPAVMIDLHAKVALLTNVSKRLHEAIRAHVEEHGDVVANDQRLTISNEKRRKLDTVPAFQVLEAEGFGDSEWSECMEIKLSKAEQIVKEQAPERGGAKAIRELDAKLEAAGAIKTAEIRKLVTRRG